MMKEKGQKNINRAEKHREIEKNNFLFLTLRSQVEKYEHQIPISCEQISKYPKNRKQITFPSSYFAFTSRKV